MSKPYKYLRTILRDLDIDQEYLSKMLGKSPGYISTRMMAHKAWTLGDMYTIMDEFNIPYEEMHLVFPNYRDRKRVWPEMEPPVITKRDAAVLVKAKQIADAFNITLDDLVKNSMKDELATRRLQHRG